MSPARRVFRRITPAQVDLGPLFDPNAPLIYPTTPLPFIYQCFTLLGVRHLPVVDSRLRVQGMITRKDTSSQLIERRISSSYRTTESPYKLLNAGVNAALSPSAAFGASNNLFLRITYRSTFTATSPQVADNRTP